MSRDRPEESWAAEVMTRTLDVPVKKHDDGSQPGMHDLEIRRPDRVDVVEVTQAIDGAASALWRHLNGGDDRWIDGRLAGGWAVDLDPTAKAKRIVSELPALLSELESQGLRELYAGYRRRNLPSVMLLAESLGVVSATQGETDYPGSIYITVHQPRERMGGAVPATAEPVVKWIGELLREPDRADNLAKLARSGATERHMFIVIRAFAPVPFAVNDIFMRGGVPLPADPPDLPGEVTHVWIMSTWSQGPGMRWGPHEGWQFFAK